MTKRGFYLLFWHCIAKEVIMKNNVVKFSCFLWCLRESKIESGSLIKTIMRPGGGDSRPSDGDQVALLFNDDWIWSVCKSNRLWNRAFNRPEFVMGYMLLYRLFTTALFGHCMGLLSNLQDRSMKVYKLFYSLRLCLKPGKCDDFFFLILTVL